ncbi:helix-turn-helix domain-containing protein [Streptomyces sp. DH12]|uniref:helix-turn-helix domain-containing protein n=1 Tax=Streptomyces sp. DH12 TaxID=2857010 RepID=UPI001E409F87|nr:helix-turn-helix transcriptional regulator [Streptomyces sp. DH12]
MSATIGSRLRELRKLRGLTQAELASLTKRLPGTRGVSVATIRLLEQERAGDTRAETLHDLARVLRVPTSRLLGDTKEPEHADTETTDRWKAVRAALTHPPIVAEGLDRPPTVEGVRGAFRDLEPHLKRLQLDELSTLMPRVIRDADALGSEGRAVRMRVLQTTAWLLTQTRQFDAAEMALERATDEGEDHLELATTVNTKLWLLLRTGQLGAARDLAVQWADETEPRRISRATPDELCAWGWMLLRVSNASVRDNRATEADHAMRLARGAAEVLGREYKPPSEVTRTFGPTTVAMKSAENASIRHRPDLVLRLAGEVPVYAVRPSTSNRNRHRLDVAGAHLSLRQYSETIGKLREIHASAPEWLPNQRLARDIVDRLIDRRRALTPEMRRLANVVKLPV